jgi:hypothetical protein
VVREVVEQAPPALQPEVLKVIGFSRQVLQPLSPRKESGLQVAVASFFCEDGNSRATAGKKDTIGRGDKKVQKRILLASIEALYGKFLASHPDVKCSSRSFYRYKPEHVVMPSPSDREQCLCLRCENLDLLVQAMHNVRLISHRDKHQLLRTIVCQGETLRDACLSRVCHVCRGRSPIDKDVAASQPEVRYGEWRSKEGASGMEVVMQTVGCEMAVTTLLKDLRNFASHHMRMMHQYRAIKEVKKEMDPEHLVLHVDFSENYSAKYHREVQSAHFGDRQQVTIHQGVAYLSDDRSISFASLSDDNNKKAEAIAAHLVPVLKSFELAFGKFERVTFISDSPSSQYRNRRTLHIVDSVLRKMDILRWEWIYTEAGHGKGAADGVGAAIKRRCDARVSTGEQQQVTSAKDVDEAMKLGILTARL